MAILNMCLISEKKCSILFGFWTMPSGAKELLLALYLGITYSRPKGTYGIMGKEPGSASFKANNLPFVFIPAPIFNYFATKYNYRYYIL